MAPSFAHLPPYAKAAFIAAQLDALAGPDEPIEDPFEAPTEALIEQRAEAPLVEQVKAPVEDPPATDSAPEKRTRNGKKTSKLTASNRAKALLRAAKKPNRRIESDDSDSSFEHHRRKCQVCNHPDREAIEELFLAWHSPRSIRIEFGTYHRLDCSSIYRHARAAGLYAKRRKNLRAVFDLILEHAGNIEPTAHGIVAIVRAYSCLTDTHEWIEPERRVHVVNHVYRHDLPALAGVPACPDEGRAVPGVPASSDAVVVLGGRSFSSDTQTVKKDSSFRANYPRDVVPPQSAFASPAVAVSGGMPSALCSTENSAAPVCAASAETAPLLGGRSFSSDMEALDKDSSFRAPHPPCPELAPRGGRIRERGDVVSSKCLPASLPPNLPASASNRHTPEIRIASNSHKTNDRNISNRHISHPVSTQTQKEKSPKTALASSKDNLAGGDPQDSGAGANGNTGWSCKIGR